MQSRPHPTPLQRLCDQADRGIEDGPHHGAHVEAVLDAFDRSEVSKPVARALSHLLRNYSSAVSVQDLADLSGWSAFQVIRAFRKELGITPHALLIRIRVLSATTLLKQGEPIAGVAVDVGFVDQTHFTRHFKRMHGNTPGNYLKARQVALGEMRGAI